jgi:mannose-1-phosphate guanylyltransferase
MKEKILKLIDERIEFWKNGKLSEHTRIIPSKIEVETKDIFTLVNQSIVTELEFIRKEIEKLEENRKSIEKMIEKCMEISGYPEELKHRFYYNFGIFLQDMVNYLVWKQLSEDSILREFQKTINVNDYNPEKFETYLELFMKFYEWMDGKEDD